MSEQMAERPSLGEQVAFEDWLEVGRKRGWISKPVCATHHGIPTTLEGEKEWDEGLDPCEHIVRLWPDYETPVE